MSKWKPDRMSLEDQIRQAMIDSGKSQYRITKDTGISQPLITRFVNVERDVSLDRADKLVQYLGMELRVIHDV